jgi:hypothetical protein
MENSNGSDTVHKPVDIHIGLGHCLWDHSTVHDGGKYCSEDPVGHYSGDTLLYITGGTVYKIGTAHNGYVLFIKTPVLCLKQWWTVFYERAGATNFYMYGYTMEMVDV